MTALEPAPHLPIDDVLPQFVAALAGERPVVVAATTGSGKSTRLPLCLEKASDGPILVIEPRRVACRALASWLCTQEASELGGRIGYHVRFDRKVGAQTRIVFATPGMALALIAGPRPTQWGVVMLDEFHERSWELDLVLALARQGRFGPGSKLVLCSATLDAAHLEQSLGATTVVAKGRAHPITVSHLGDGPPRTEGLTDRVVTGVTAALKASPGDCLVFLPGKREISEARGRLGHVGAELVAVHGGVPVRVLTQAFAPSAQRRVFLATNVAETSITIPSVTSVVDAGLVRRRLHRSGRSVLAVVPISAASMHQRAGRAGRVGPGICVRLWAEQFQPEAHTPPEIERVELDDVLLRAAMCGVAPGDFEALPWLTPPPPFAVEQARSRLVKRGAVAPDGELTDAGRIQAALPVSALGARILGGAPKPLLRSLAALVAVVELRRELLQPVVQNDAVEPARRKLLAAEVDEPGVAMTLLLRGDVRRHGLHAAGIREATSIATSLCRQVGGDVAGPLAPRGDLVRHLLAAIPDRVFVRRERSRRGGPIGASAPWGNGTQELMVRSYTIPARDPDAQPKPPVAGIVLDAEWLGTGTGARGVGGMVVRCETADLVRAGIGERIVGTPVLDRKRHRVMAPVTLTHAGIQLGTSEVKLEGEALCDALALFILRGSLRRGLADRFVSAHHTWQLLAGWTKAKGGGDVEIPPPPQNALAGRLMAAGVAAFDDLSLLEPEDCLPPVELWAAHNGVGERELRSLVADFPRLFAFEGKRYACAVDFVGKNVLMTPADSATKKEPPARVLPRFRGFSVSFQRASRSLRVR